MGQIVARPPRCHSASRVPDGEKTKRGLEDEEEEEGEEGLDRISHLPDVLGDIVSLLPTNDGARTQVLSSRWRHIWRSSPLNIDLNSDRTARFRTNHEVSRIISHVLLAHQGPVRRFSIPGHYLIYRDFPATNLDGWLQCPVLDGLQELDLAYCYCKRDGWNIVVPPLPASVHRFSSTLRVASFSGCSFPDGNHAGGLQFPVLKQLSLSDVRFSERSLHALLAACPVLESLLLTGRMGCSCVRIVSPALRSIGVQCNCAIFLEQLIIEDAPSLERLLCFDPYHYYGNGITISVISAPRLLVLGPLTGHRPRLESGSTVLQGLSFVRLNAVVHSVKVLTLTLEHPCLHVIIGMMKCFPCLEKLYIKIKKLSRKENVWGYKLKGLIGNLDIRIKKIVLEGYQGDMSHVNFAKFFVLNARLLESMRLQIFTTDPSNEWIDKQHKLLEIKNRASRDIKLDFASGFGPLFSFFCREHVHDLSTADPF